MTIKTKDIVSKEIFTVREAAALLNVTTQTIKNYIYAGKLKVLKTPGGHHRIRRIDLKSLGFAVEEEKGPKNFSMDELWSAYNNLLNTIVSTVESFTKALDTRDIVSSGHSSRVADLSCTVGDVMGFSENELRDLRLRLAN